MVIEFMNNDFNIRECILNSQIGEKLNNYITVLDDLSNYMAVRFFDYSIFLKTTADMIIQLENKIISKNSLLVSTFHFYKYAETKKENIKEEFKNRIPSCFTIPVEETDILYSLSLDEIFNSLDKFIIKFREWLLEPNDIKLKRNISDLNECIELMFKELAFFRHELFIIFSSNDYDYYGYDLNVNIKNNKSLYNVINEYIDAFDTLYSDINEINYKLKKSINFTESINLNKFVKQNLSEKDILNIINNTINEDNTQQNNNSEEDW